MNSNDVVDDSGSVTMRTKKTAAITVFYAFCILLTVVMALPFFWSLMTAIRPNHEIFQIPMKWLPSEITFEHFKQAFTLVPFGRYFYNSFSIAFMGVLLNLFFGSLGGYAFAKLRFKGKQSLFRLLLAAMMIPPVVVFIPQFIVLMNVPLIGGNDILGSGGHGLLNSFWGVVLPGAAGTFAVFLMRQFFMSLPDDLMESARIEGCGEFRIYWNIYLPLTKPALATLAIFTFQAGWNNFLWPLIVLNDPSKATVQMGLQAFSYNNQTNFGPLMAASIAVMLPIILIFVYLQKYFMQGIAFSGIKE